MEINQTNDVNDLYDEMQSRFEVVNIQNNYIILDKIYYNIFNIK